MASSYDLGGENTYHGVSQPVNLEPVGSIIGGRYEVVRVLGRGGMGAVYECQDSRLLRRVAVKRLLLQGAVALERFQREARSVAGIRHAGVVSVLDYEVDDRGPFIVMELLEGQDLQSRVARNGALPLAEVVALGVSACRALHHAHQIGIVHRDVKPSNLFLESTGVLKVVDFGLARDGGDQQLSVVGVGLGTADYVAPEQQDDAARADAKSDQYSLGMVLYFLASSKRPRVLRPNEIPEPLRDIILRMIEEDPKDRFDGLEDVARLLESLRQSGAQARPSTFAEVKKVEPAGSVRLPPSPSPESAKFRALRQAAEQGNVDQLTELANAYWGQVDGVASNPPYAVQLYQLADALGSTGCKFQLAVAYSDGVGVDVDGGKSLAYALQGAEVGDVECVYLVAKCHHFGIGVDVNYTESVRWLEKAVARRHPVGMLHLGMSLLAGDGIAQNPQRAYKLIASAAELGLVEARLRLGFLYLNGIGTTEDQAEAFRWFEMAATQGSGGAAVQVGNSYRHGWGVASNAGEAFKWYQAAHETGDLEGAAALGLAYLEGIGTPADVKAALPLLKQAAEGGDAESAIALAKLYKSGTGVVKSLRQAADLLAKAAQAGSAEAMYELAELVLEGGPGVPVNTAVAVKYFVQASEAGNVAASCRYAVLLHEGGRGIKKNVPEAVRILREVAAADEMTVQHLEGLRYLVEILLETSDAAHAAEAVALLRKAVELEDAECQSRLADLLSAGIPGVEVDVEEAFDLYVAAGTLGYEPAWVGAAEILIHHDIKDCDLKSRAEIYEVASGQDSPEAMVALSLLHIEGKVPGVPQRTKELLLAAANMGSVDAMWSLGWCLSTQGSYLGEVDHHTARKLFEQGAALKDLRCMRGLALSLDAGKCGNAGDVARRAEKRRAYDLYSELFKNNDALSAFMVGYHLATGEPGFGRDTQRAAQFFKWAQDKNPQEAQVALAFLVESRTTLEEQNNLTQAFVVMRQCGIPNVPSHAVAVASTTARVLSGIFAVGSSIIGESVNAAKKGYEQARNGENTDFTKFK